MYYGHSPDMNCTRNGNVPYRTDGFLVGVNYYHQQMIVNEFDEFNLYWIKWLCIQKFYWIPAKNGVQYSQAALSRNLSNMNPKGLVWICSCPFFNVHPVVYFVSTYISLLVSRDVERIWWSLQNREYLV